MLNIKHTTPLSSVFDFNLIRRFCHAVPTFLWEATDHARRTDHFLATARPLSQARVRHVRAALRWQPAREGLLVLRPVSFDGLRATDGTREPARHRDVPSRHGAHTLPRGVSRQRLAQHP